MLTTGHNAGNTKSAASFASTAVSDAKSAQTIQLYQKRVVVLCGQLDNMMTFNELLQREKDMWKKRYEDLAHETAAQRHFICRNCMHKDAEIAILAQQNEELTRTANASVRDLVDACQTQFTSVSGGNTDSQFASVGGGGSDKLAQQIARLNVIGTDATELTVQQLDDLHEKIRAVEHEIMSLKALSVDESQHAQYATQPSVSPQRRTPTSYLHLLHSSSSRRQRRTHTPTTHKRSTSRQGSSAKKSGTTTSNANLSSFAKYETVGGEGGSMTARTSRASPTRKRLHKHDVIDYVNFLRKCGNI